MGIPKFFRWLITRYPYICTKVERDKDIPPIDYFYIDLNSLIHNIIHGDVTDKIVITSHLMNTGQIDEIWANIFKTLDDLVHTVNPRKLLMVALDGVPPIAKMVQQRSRRIKDEKAEAEIEYKAKTQHEKVLFDISSISPGTAFMTELNKRLDFFLQAKMEEDPLYQRIRVIFSDSSTPGEGEQKIMEFIRDYKHSPFYNPNFRHCIYGVDTDLIMLGLLTHEPNMIILKDIIDPFVKRSSIAIPRQQFLKDMEYTIVYISLLRECFELEFKDLEPKLAFPFNIERIIDDFVFFSFFVGNDFLPTLSTVDINHGSMDMIMKTYKELLPKLGGYITDNGVILWENAEKIFVELGKSEVDILKDRYTSVEESKKSQFKDKLKKTFESSSTSESEEEDIYLDPKLRSSQEFYKKLIEFYNTDSTKGKVLYYSEKLNIDIKTGEGVEQLKDVIFKYLQGLQWVFHYYYKGVQHWGWFYPYYYAPLISDIHSTKVYDIMNSFAKLKEPNHPIEPFEQLLCILPKYSMDLIPSRYHKLYDKDSEIYDMYPKNYEIDYNGRDFEWEAVKLIPTLDVCRVIAAKDKLSADPGVVPLTESEKERNVFHNTIEYSYSKDPVIRVVQSPLKNFPNLVNPHSIREEWKACIDPVKASFSASLPKDIEMPCYDFPSFKHLKCLGGEVNQDKEEERLKIVLEDTNLKNLHSLIGKIVYINYPYQTEARIVSIATKKSTISEIVCKETNAISIREIAIDNTMLLNDIIESFYGVGLRCALKESMNFVCYCCPLKFITKSIHRPQLYTKIYDTKRILVPSFSLMFKRDERHYQNCDEWMMKQTLQYPIGAPCAIVYGEGVGSVGTIIDNKEEGKVSIKIDTRIDRKASDSLWDICDKFNKKPSTEVYTSMRVIANTKLNTTKYVVGKILSSTKVKLSEKKGKRVFNIGLNALEFFQKLHIPYHVVYNINTRDWAISNELVDYVVEYYKRCPKVFTILGMFEVDKSIHKMPTSADLFPQSPDPDKAVEDLFDWIMLLPISRLPFIPMGTAMIRPELYSEIKKKVAVESDVQPTNQTITKNLSEVFVERRPFWIKPYSSKKMENSFRIGDRVISVKTTDSVFVPFGCPGTIIGLNNRNAIVEFDQQLITGMNFYGMDGHFREAIVDVRSLFNLYGNKKEYSEKQQTEEPSERKESNVGRGELRGSDRTGRGWRRGSWRREQSKNQEVKLQTATCEAIETFVKPEDKEEPDKSEKSPEQKKDEFQ